MCVPSLVGRLKGVTMDYSKTLIHFATPRPDRKAKRWSRCWKDVRKRPRQYKTILVAA